MFEWKVEDMKLMNEKSYMFYGEERIFNCESKISREDKITFVDSMQEEKLSYLLKLQKKFDKDKDSLPKDCYGNIKTVSLKAWIKRNDNMDIIRKTKTMFDGVGDYKLFTTRNLEFNDKAQYDTYDDFVDEVFHRQLKDCLWEEKKYFREHDEYNILCEKLEDSIIKNNVWLASNISIGNEVKILKNNEESRPITMDELKLLLSKYEELETYIKKLSSEVNIKY